MTVLSHNIYVAMNGDDTNDGNVNAPYLTIHKAVEMAQPGDTIYVRGGIYMLTSRIKIPVKATSADARICLFGYPEERVIIDGSQIVTNTENEFKMARCIYVNHEANYWHFKNLELCNAKDNGMKVEGSFNIIENCVFHDNNDTGLQIGMYKDFSIEETKELPVGNPKFNPDYQFCKYNVVINCDSYNNFDSKSFSGTDDGGDADGFACKLFPGPGTEFISCRAWNNSDDNWDLYMVYHPVRIDNCWAWKAGYDKNGVERKNGNGFKLGGGGTSGGAAFSQSVGAHVITNCISFDNLHKGFDQNNAYEAMYLFNNVAWGNEFNYRFPTVFQYGSMYMRNNIGFKATKQNHEFLSADKTGSKIPNTSFNSWTTLDGCDPYKEGNKVGSTKVYTKDYTNQFKSLSTDLAKAERNSDGSLPENDFCHLKDGSVFIDKGEIIQDFIPTRFMIEAEANGLELIALPSLTIPYNDISADMGANEAGNPTMATLKLLSGNTSQTVFRGSTITPIVYKWGQAATNVAVSGLVDGLSAVKNNEEKTVTISGIASQDATIVLVAEGGVNEVAATITIAVSDLYPGTLVCLTNNRTQTVDMNMAIEDIVFEMGGGATSFVVASLPSGLVYHINDNRLTIGGVPVEDGTYTVTASGGMENIVLSGTINRVIPTKILTGDWYHIQDNINTLPLDLINVVFLVKGSSDAAYPTVWDPTYAEKETVPPGCTVGAVNMERDGGGIEWRLSSLSELKVNLHFTGNRTFKVVWQIEGETEKSWTSSSMSKQTAIGWDVMKNAGIEQTFKPITIKLLNVVSSGGTRVYDFFVRVYKESATNISPVFSEEVFSVYRTSTALIVQGVNVSSLRLFSMSGEQVACSFASQVIEFGKAQNGVYILQIVKKDGQCISKKVWVDQY